MTESKPVVLRSAANPTVRHLVRMRDNRARRKAGRVIVDGWRETAQAIDAGLRLCGIYLSESMSIEDQTATAAKIRYVLKHADQSNRTTYVSDSMMEKIGYGQSSRGVVAEFVRPTLQLQKLKLPASPLILVLDRIEKPGNIGAVFRCADAAGLDAVLLCDTHDLFNPNAIRSSLGCVFHVPAAIGTQTEIEQFLLARSIRAVAARVESSTPLWTADLGGPLAVILGSEAEGLGDRWQTLGDRPVEGIRIPMAGRADSLNVSVSAAVIAFEASRRRLATGSG
jgi:TrmH family RNA methyltransferase